MINLGWIPGYLMTLGNMVRKAKTDSTYYPYRSEHVDNYGKKVMLLMDADPMASILYSDLHSVSKIMADCEYEGKTPEYCYQQIRQSYGL
jgi:hypothetical protein